jgi:ankyrin repeat protein
VFCQLDTLRRCMPSSIRKALNELPTTLDGTYERALQEIPKEKWQHAHRLFQCLVVAIRPLRVEELAELFAIDFDPDTGPNLEKGWRPKNPGDAVLSTCSTLIAVIEYSDSKIVQFCHFSVKEFLTSDRLRTSEIENIRHYHIPLDAAHTILARACLSVLLQLDENVDKTCLKTFPLAFYAAQHWVDHAMYEDVASQVQGLMEQLFNPSKQYLAAWTWIQDMDVMWWRQHRRSRETIYDLEGCPKRPGVTALYYVALCGFSGPANYLIITHAENVNAKCGNHGTPLHAAAYNGHLDVARLLLDHGVDVNTTNKRNKTPLCSAYDGLRLDSMRLLLEHGADVDAYYDTLGLLLHDASYRGRADVVHLLLQHKANVNARNIYEETPLHYASKEGQAKAAQLLLENGAIVNVQNGNGNTPLYEALMRMHLEVVHVLLKHGADVHMRGDNGCTPFQVATTIGLDEAAQLLLEHGAKRE